MPCALRRDICPNAPELQRRVAEDELVAVLKRRAVLERAPSKKRAVLAAEILERGASVGRDPQHSVAPGDPVVFEGNGGLGSSPEHVVAGSEVEPPPGPKDPADRAWTLNRLSLSSRFPREGIAEYGNRSDQSRGPGVVAGRGANLGHQRVECGVGDECIRPEELMQLLARDRLGPLFEEDFQQPKSLGRDVNRASGARELARLRIEKAIPKSQAQGFSPGSRNHRISTILQRLRKADNVRLIAEGFAMACRARLASLPLSLRGFAFLAVWLLLPSRASGQG